MDGWVDGWVGGWMGGWMDGWKDEKMSLASKLYGVNGTIIIIVFVILILIQYNTIIVGSNRLYFLYVILSNNA